ncbi:MAG: hypothetical protein LBF63_00905 [Treponema sp.]|jgi:hypothetical protein|nr:hypothetical protein [Treponema sp.]
MSKIVPVFAVVFALFFVSTGLPAQENHELKLANLCYDKDDYAGAYTHFQNVILWHGDTGVSGDMLYRYAYSCERLWGLDATALRIYALSLYHFQKKEQLDLPYAQYAAAKLKNSFPNLDNTAAAMLLEELRTGIEGERKARFYRHIDRFYDFFSRFSFFQWKIIISLIMTLPFFIGLAVLTRKQPRGTHKRQ